MPDYLPSIQDGDYSTAVLLGTSPDASPFTRFGDSTTKTYTRSYLQTLGTFSTGVLGSVDPIRAGFYLLEELGPELAGAGLVSFKRTFCNLSSSPRYQYSTLNFDRKNLDGFVSGGTRYVSFDDGQTSTKFTSTKAVASVSAASNVSTVAQAAESLGDLTGQVVYFKAGGTTLSITCGSLPYSLGFTNTALSYSSSESKVAISLTTLDSTPPLYSAWSSTAGVSVECSVSGATATFTITKAKPAQSSAQTITAPDQQATRTVTTSGAHGYSVGTRVGLWNGATLVAKTSVYEVVSSTAFKVPAEDLTASNFTATLATGLGGDSVQTIANGNKVCSVRNRTVRYLCGVSAGITTPADITIPDGINTPAQWFAAQSLTWAPLGIGSLEDLGGGWVDATFPELQVSDALEVL
jgi:hypothetical protein